MYEAFTKVDKFLKRKPKIHDPRPDNFVFRLHYQYTFTILAISVILVTSYTYIDSEGKSMIRETKSILVDQFNNCFDLQDLRYNV